VLRVGPTVDNLGNNLRESRWGVPRIGAVVLPVIPEKLYQLREVATSREYALDGAVEVIAVRRDLESVIG
jgi:hypothetical protein